MEHIFQLVGVDKRGVQEFSRNWPVNEPLKKGKVFKLNAVTWEVQEIVEIDAHHVIVHVEHFEPLNLNEIPTHSYTTDD